MASRILRGTVQFAGVTEFHEDVVIAAGTTVHLEAGASLLFGGRVTALGTAEQPIRFVSSAPDELPWGTIALTSTGCSGSRLRWCEFRGGSGWMTELAEYPSMFAIHNCDDVTVEHCRFEEPHQFDDVIHVVYAECTFDDVAVIGALSDALDCDISKVTVRNSTFRNSGNDDIDLSATDAVIHDCLFQGSGDRGVSADLGSRLLVVRGSFRGCEQGLEVKDGSVAVVANSDIRGGKRAVSATRGDRRYPAGGHLTIAKSSVLDNAVGPIADRWSRVLLTDCQFRGDVPTEYDQHEVDGTVLRVKNAALVEDHDAGPEPRSIAPLPFPVELQPVENMADEVWRTVRADRRGLPDAN